MFIRIYSARLVVILKVRGPERAIALMQNHAPKVKPAILIPDNAKRRRRLIAGLKVLGRKLRKPAYVKMATRKTLLESVKIRNARISSAPQAGTERGTIPVRVH